jgi:hypothetical protein
MLKGCRGHNCRIGRKPWDPTRSLRTRNRRIHEVDPYYRQQHQRKTEDRLQKQYPDLRKQDRNTNKGNVKM